MKILVTGGRGFIGSNLVNELRRRGHQVWLCDLGVYYDDHYIEADVRSYYQMGRVFQRVQPEMVYHAAAVAGRWHGEAYFDSLWTTNVVGTENILALLREYPAKLVFFSSSEVYGDYAGGVMTEDVMNRDEVRQHNSYGLSKWVGEQLCLKAAAMYHLKIVRVRPLNVYGPGEYYSPYRSAVIKFIYHALHDRPFPVYEGHKRNFTYITDIVNALANIADNFRPGACYNLGAPLEHMHTMETVAEIILGYLGKPWKLAENMPSEPHTVPVKPVDSRRAAEELGLRTTVTLEEGLIKTINWAREYYRRVRDEA